MLKMTLDGRTSFGSELQERSGHEWSEAPAELNLTVAGDVVIPTGGSRTESFTSEPEAWAGASPAAKTLLKLIRQDLENFRTSAVVSPYLDDIDPADLIERLGIYYPPMDWSSLPSEADVGHRAAWDKVSNSKELRNIARRGYELYNLLFPKDSPLRTYLDAFPPGGQIKLTWTLNANGAAYVPWGLLYRTPPRMSGPIDPREFWGLRHRIEYRVSFNKKPVGRFLGDLENTSRLYIIFQDTSDGTVQPQAAWQRELWGPLWPKNLVFAPTSGSISPKAQVIELLDTLAIPDHPPFNLVYLYCHCGTNSSSAAPILRFGNALDSVVQGDEIGLGSADAQPLIFANACSTAASDPYFTNELMTAFLNRGCRAFIGTEARVPPILSARLAHVFFHFFMQGDVAAGEALAQARLFLWSQYKNVGGLFYSLVNEYQLFLREKP